MTGSIKTFIQKPFLGMSKIEQEKLLDVVRVAIKNGTTVVLGDKRCFLCGTELGEVIDITKIGNGDHLLYVRLCDSCSKNIKER